MAFLAQQKITRITLYLYWPAFFIATHVPIPEAVQKAGVSDKSLHFLAYLMLVFLLWFAVSGVQKVDWRGLRPWLVLLVLISYGIIDELLQGLVPGRSPDAADFVADVTGVAAGMILFTILSFWHAGLLIGAMVIFSVANISRIDLAFVMPVAYAVFHLFAYAVFTLLWINYLQIYTSFSARKSRIKWLALASTTPVGLLLAVKLSAISLGKGFAAADTAVSAGAIVVVTAAFYLNASFCGRSDGGSGG